MAEQKDMTVPTPQPIIEAAKAMGLDVFTVRDGNHFAATIYLLASDKVVVVAISSVEATAEAAGRIALERAKPRLEEAANAALDLNQGDDPKDKPRKLSRNAAEHAIATSKAMRDHIGASQETKQGG